MPNYKIQMNSFDIWHLCFICILDFVIWNLKINENSNFYQNLVSH
jgi:hypothetical protein